MHGTVFISFFKEQIVVKKYFVSLFLLQNWSCDVTTKNGSYPDPNWGKISRSGSKHNIYGSITTTLTQTNTLLLSNLLNIFELTSDLLGGAVLCDPVDGGHDGLLDDLPLDEALQHLGLLHTLSSVLTSLPLHYRKIVTYIFNWMRGKYDVYKITFKLLPETVYKQNTGFQTKQSPPML